MKKLLFIGVLVFLVSSDSATKLAKTQSYTSTKFGLSFTYPTNWTFLPDEANNYLSFYTPECFQNTSKSLELLRGLKIEILKQLEGEDFQENLAQDTPLSETTTLYRQYFHAEPDCYYIITFIPRPNNNLLIIGYIPEKDKKTAYLAQYQNFVSQLKILP